MITQLTIVGTGLIGGSFGLAVRKHGFHGRIVGCDREPVLDRARRRGAVDVAIVDPIAACAGSQVVVLATPVGAIIDLIERLGPVLPAETLITDCGSTKQEIVARARAVFGAATPDRFLGGHPMAGKEHGGIDHADAELFRDAPWILTPTRGQNLLSGTQNHFLALLETIGARLMTVDAEQQDRLCAWVSHLPQMISTALAGTLVDEFAAAADPNAPGEGAPTLDDVHAVGGRALREMTRISASPYSMWRDIAFTNTANIEHALHRLEQRLAHLRENLRTPELRSEFENANRFEERKRLPQRHRDPEE